MAQDLFSEMDIEWTPVSTALVKGRRLAGSITFVFLLLFIAVGAGFVMYFAPAPWGLVVAISLLPPVLGMWAWYWFWVPRNQASWGYFEGEKELLIKSGIMFRRLVVVPYGRMQFVDVESGPIATANGYATVTLNTASTQTAADIPGVPTAEAHRLRDRLTELGDSQGSGV